MLALILRVNASGRPVAWINWQEATQLYSKNAVLWDSGDETLRVYGGHNRLSGNRSFIDVRPVIAVKGRVSQSYSTTPLSNRELFRRDRHMCLYCLRKLPDHQLTRDHVIPVSLGGEDAWTNVVAACKSCNNSKAARTPEEANMKLHALPYAPNVAEWLILYNRRIRADQMAFLQAHCPKKSPWRN